MEYALHKCNLWLSVFIVFYLLVFCNVCWSFQRYCCLCCSLCQMWSRMTSYVFRDQYQLTGCFKKNTNTIIFMSFFTLLSADFNMKIFLYIFLIFFFFFVMRSVVICKSIWKVIWSLTHFLSIDWMLDVSVRDVCDLWPRGHRQYPYNFGCSFLHQAPEIAAKLSSFRAPPGLEEVRFYFPHYLIWWFKFGQDVMS